MGLPQLLLEVSGLLALAVVLGLLARRARLPLTVVLVVVGFVVSSAGAAPAVGAMEGETFEHVAILGFLPALVFAASLGIDLRAFVRNLGAILALAVVAFGLSALVVGVALHALLGTALVVAFLFGVLISATDPVAVVAIFRELGVPRRLLTLVEGESLLNDGVAIVLFAILVDAATGGTIDAAGGALDFVRVFAGGALIGAVAGVLAAAVLPWLDPLPAVTLSLSVAYGTFVVAEEVLGVSGVVATAVAGMVLSGLAPSRASAEVREAWEQTWEAIDYVANALLFLLIGLVLGPIGVGGELGSIALAVIAVLVARALAVVPVVWLLERFARIPRLGMRNEAVLVWGGLRGGVALALALALPSDLEGRETLVALTGGVVLATLLLNATTIRRLVHRLGLDRPGDAELFLSAVARLGGVAAARRRVEELGLDDAEELTQQLDRLEEAAREELQRLQLDEEQEARVVLGRALHVERLTYQQLSDERLLPPAVTRTLLREVDDEVDDLSLHGAVHEAGSGRRDHSRLDDLVRRLLAWLPRPPGEDPEELSYAEASARRLASRQTGQALDLFERLPAISAQTVDRVRRTFQDWEEDAIRRLDELDERSGRDRAALHERQAALLAQAAVDQQVRELVSNGLLPPRLQGARPHLA